ncbi:class II peroxidase [Hypholoma sublateritium FD-334 SS-4]|uniref:Peroxidase n=1 Tax=Hypholoma sublateritium (strain FD-334 SS-4) TaxID=945553 RepID=A0A0D2P4E1_HYPSF|nr:class II peroxidase [Hypholoma sublateritium FD-334 SS-4]
MVFSAALSALALSLPLLSVNALRTRRALCPDGVNTAINLACCSLFPVVQDIQENFLTNECGDSAHGALRLVFHDAIGISPTAGGGGADGSIATFNETELTFPANLGIDDILDEIGPFLLKHSNTMSPGDFIQLAGALSLVQCPGAPRIPFFMGRAQPKAASPPNLVPQPFDSVASIVQRFGEVGFTTPEEIVAVVGGSHSVAGADDVVPGLQGLPFDQTPSVFDTQIFVDVQLRGTIFTGQGGNQGETETSVLGTVRLQSDHLLARDSQTNCAWQSFANNQAAMAEAFGQGVLKLSLLGQNQDELTDCSEVIPAAIPFTGGPATLPPGLTMNDIEQACATAAFPSLATQPGPATSVPAIPQADDDDDS